MACIPILCQIMCEVFRYFGSVLIDDRVTGLYERFTKVLAKRRDRSDWKEKLASDLNNLGSAAFDALIDNRSELWDLEFDCESVLKTEPGESGFIQLDSVTNSDFEERKIVTFLHKSFQEYSAAYYFAHLYDENKEKFSERLKQINSDNVFAMEYVLRFACGLLKESPATEEILEHVQKQQTIQVHDVNSCWHLEGGNCRESRSLEVQTLVRVLLFETGSTKMVDKLDRPTYVQCRRPQEDWISLQHYLKCVRELQCPVFSMLRCVAFYGTYLHGRVKSLALLVHPSLYSFTAHVNDMVDDDVDDLISIFPPERTRDLTVLDLSGNYLNAPALVRFSVHLGSLPKLDPDKIRYVSTGDYVDVNEMVSVGFALGSLGILFESPIRVVIGAETSQGAQVGQ
ncbi:uncharacterized protein LOC119738592 [Patiria miniata]|uniref:Uncharacterized protein n=1 Tax=Patiria miniata TaxID=46514 RepID=A0A914B0C4_PATMI|nr:uncharacterized protein LOC119738592 [Patiria miniata]